MFLLALLSSVFERPHMLFVASGRAAPIPVQGAGAELDCDSIV